MTVDLDQLRELWASELTLKQIALKLGTDYRRVSEKAKKLGLPPRAVSSGNRPTNQWVELYQQGWSVTQISRKFGACHTVVRRLLMQRGIKMRGWTGTVPDLREECVRLWRMGYDQNQIAEKVGLTKGQVGYRIRSILGAGSKKEALQTQKLLTSAGSLTEEFLRLTVERESTPHHARDEIDARLAEIRKLLKTIG